ncbi:sigma-70 family RNA polymerase sigma factor [Luteolibacter yonseiensis]|nr:sigma-70 family RNA polymerase sigma factor [Luteolibacter yonseiensis]
MSGSAPNNFPPDRRDHGSVQEFDPLLLSHQHRIYFFIRSMVFNPDDARDVLQDVNAIIIRKRDRFSPGTDFKSWSFAIARYECLAYLRRHQAKQSVASDGLLEYLAEEAEPRADDVDSWLKALAECRKLLAEESDRLLEFRYQKRVPLEEIARLWKTTEGALKQKLFRVRNQLKKCVLRRFAETTGEECD